MRFKSKTFCLPKDSEYPDQYQDAFDLDAPRGIAAIADGVSSAIFSGPWARLLTKATVEQPLRLEEHETFRSWLGRQRTAWSGGIDISKLAWHQRPKMVNGAMSTLLWIELWPDENQENGASPGYHWYGFAIGDCQLFHVRQGQILSWFPMQSSAEFGLNPAVLGSIDRKLDHLLEFKAVDGLCQPGDLLVLCTDAIGLWAMTRHEAGQPVDWEPYWDLSHDAWRDEIFSLRRDGRMRFDDSTLVLLRVIEEVPAELPPDETAPLEGAGAVEAAEAAGEVSEENVELPTSNVQLPTEEEVPAETAEIAAPVVEASDSTVSENHPAEFGAAAPEVISSHEALGGVEQVDGMEQVLSSDNIVGEPAVGET